MYGTVLSTTVKENDFGLTSSADMKVSKQRRIVNHKELKCLTIEGT